MALGTYVIRIVDDTGNSDTSKGTSVNQGNKNNKLAKDSEVITKSNLNKSALIGNTLKAAGGINELAGHYTQNRIKQRKIDTGLSFAKYGAGIAMFGGAGVAYMALDLGMKMAHFQIESHLKNIEADYFKNLSGNDSMSGTRYRGGYL